MPKESFQEITDLAVESLGGHKGSYRDIIGLSVSQTSRPSTGNPKGKTLFLT